MLNITDSASFARAMDSPLDPELRRLLLMRRDQLLADTGGNYELGELVHFIAVDCTDTVPDIEAAAGYPVVGCPSFEWVADHGKWLEAVVVLSDSGMGLALFVPNSIDIDSALLSLLRDQLKSAPTLAKNL